MNESWLRGYGIGMLLSTIGFYIAAGYANDLLRPIFSLAAVCTLLLTITTVVVSAVARVKQISRMHAQRKSDGPPIGVDDKKSRKSH
jgi:hypothetical protein